MNIKRVGIDLAKQVFQVHGIDAQERTVLRKQLRRAQLLAYFKDLPALPDRYGSLRWCSLLGERITKAGAYR